MEVRRQVPSVLVTVGAVVAVAGSFRPWVATGSAERSSYELLAIVDRLGGVSADGWSWWVVALWPAMPLVLAVTATAAWWGRRVPLTVAGVVGTAHVGVVAGAVLVGADDGAVGTLPGVMITLVGAVVVLSGLVAELVISRTTHRAR